MSGRGSNWTIAAVLALLLAGLAGGFLWREHQDARQVRGEGAGRAASPAPGPVASAPAAPAPQPPPIPSPAPPASPAPVPPSFDVVRVEKGGETVIAGRAAPGARVALLRNGEPYADVTADASGQFALVPPDLPAGTHELALRATLPDGTAIVSPQSVTAVVSPREAAPLVALTTPDRPTEILSRPEPARPPAPAAGLATPAAPAARPEIRIGAVESESAGRLYVTGTAPAGASVRLYLNDTFVAPATAGPDGRVAFSIERGAVPGDYRVRLDVVDPANGRVAARAEVPFTMPALPPPAAMAATAPAAGAAPSAGAVAPPGAAAPADPASNARAGSPAGPVAATGSAGQGASESGRTVVPQLNTATVTRGDSLWAMSKRVYGRGLRYTVIYGANAPQIRNPDLIYPGQVFVVPNP